MTPIILVTSDRREFDGYVWYATVEAYLTALSGIGATPLILPSLGDRIDINAVLDRVDGVLLTGARSNVHPARYGEEPTPRHEPFDPARDDTTMRLIPRAIARGVPLLAICRGFQELNVAYGGTLVTEAQERPGSLDHRAPPDAPHDVRFGLVHEIDPVPGGCLAAFVGSAPVRVNSVHRQAIKDLAPALSVEGAAPDGTIEAVSVTDAPAFAFGVQWHPEYWASTDGPSGKIFRAFGEAARAYMAGRFRTAAE